MSWTFGPAVILPSPIKEVACTRCYLTLDAVAMVLMAMTLLPCPWGALHDKVCTATCSWSAVEVFPLVSKLSTSRAIACRMLQPDYAVLGTILDIQSTICVVPSRWLLRSIPGCLGTRRPDHAFGLLDVLEESYTFAMTRNAYRCVLRPYLLPHTHPRTPALITQH